MLSRACLHRDALRFQWAGAGVCPTVLFNHSSPSATSVTFRALASSVTLLFFENVGRVLRLRFYHRTVVPIAPLPFERATGLPDKVMPIHRAPPWSEVIYIYIYREREREGKKAQRENDSIEGYTQKSRQSRYLRLSAQPTSSPVLLCLRSQPIRLIQTTSVRLGFCSSYSR